MFVYGTWNVGRTSWCFTIPYDTLRVYQAFWMSLMGIVIIFSKNPRRLKLKLPFPISSVHISTLTKQLTWFHAWKLCAHIHTHIYSHLFVWTHDGNHLKVNGSWEPRIPEIWSLPMRTRSPKSHGPYTPTSLCVTEAKPPEKCHCFFVFADHLPKGNMGYNKNK